MDGQHNDPSLMLKSKNHKNLSLNLPRLQQNPSQLPPRPLEVAPSSVDNRYKHGPAQILPNLFLGAFHNALQPDVINHCEISCILNVASEIEPPSVMAKTQYYHLRWTHAQKDLSQEFIRAIRVLESVLNTGAKILVHCQCGVERSAALVIAYVLYLSRRPRDLKMSQNPVGNPMSLEQAYDFVRDRAPGIRPNMELMYQLGEFEQTLPPCKQSTPSSPDFLPQGDRVLQASENYRYGPLVLIGITLTKPMLNPQ
ncbi:hypothetical protein DFQ28_007692 [Apophysomyces sp. BC1034]|nr:hypothetical protein DFQ28_007692 [Apophysomyces sp. BC1034]